MGETLNWSPGQLYEEKSPSGRSSEEFFFLYPSRLEAAVLLVFTAVVLGGLALLRFFGQSNGLIFGLGAAVALVLGLTAIVHIWEQRLIRIHRGTREISLLRRNPLRTRHDVVLADHVREIRISDGGDPAIREPERKYRVHLLRMNGDRIFLGMGEREEAIHFARRLSELLNLPLEILPSDNLRRD